MLADRKLTDTALAIAVFAASVVLRAAIAAAQENVEGLDAVTVSLLAVASLPLVFRRSAPLAVFVTSALASIALSGIAGPAGPPLAATFALYFAAAASDGSRSRNWLVLVLVGVMLAAHATASGLERGAFPGTELIFGTLLWGGAWLAGERTRLGHERIAALEERAERAERDAERERRLAAAEERTRIARDLHDSAGHAINVILVHAGLGRMRSESDPAGARGEFETIEQVARETVGEIDQLVGIMRENGGASGEVEPPPGLAALDALADRHRAAGLDVAVSRSGERSPPPAAVDHGAYRILQEALTNAARHGDGSARVVVARDAGRLELTVSNPLPAGAEAARTGGGHGIVGMRERASLLGGELEAGAVGRRFVVRAWLPVADGDR
ncbi:MAG TPA: histidine kinase [Solirubrobacterales bacterium]